MTVFELMRALKTAVKNDSRALEYLVVFDDDMTGLECDGIYDRCSDFNLSTVYTDMNANDYMTVAQLMSEIQALVDADFDIYNYEVRIDGDQSLKLRVVSSKELHYESFFLIAKA